MSTRNNRRPATAEDGVPSRRLWASVMRVAVDDLCTKNGDRAKAEAWFQSAEMHPGSFIWCCEMLDLDPGAMRSAIERGLGYSRKRYASLVREFNRATSDAPLQDM